MVSRYNNPHFLNKRFYLFFPLINEYSQLFLQIARFNLHPAATRKHLRLKNSAKLTHWLFKVSNALFNLASSSTILHILQKKTTKHLNSNHLTLNASFAFFLLHRMKSISESVPEQCSILSNTRTETIKNTKCQKRVYLFTIGTATCIRKRLSVL